MKILLTFTCLLVFALTSPQNGSGAERPEIDPRELSDKIHELVNQERTRRDLSPLAWNEELGEIALKHSEDMSDNDYFSHTNPQGETPTERGARAGFTCRKDYDTYYLEGLAENLGLNSLFQAIEYTRSEEGESREPVWNTLEDIAISTVQGWMTSQGHRQNILNPRHESGGIGVSIAEDGRIYITQLFC